MATGQIRNARNRNRLTKQQWLRSLRAPFIVMMIINTGILAAMAALLLVMDDAAQMVFRFFGLG